MIMWQTVIVILIVAVSAVCALWLLLTPASRACLAGWLAARLPHDGRAPGRLRTWLEAGARPTSSPTGCDACPQSRIAPAPDRKPPATP